MGSTLSGIVVMRVRGLHGLLAGAAAGVSRASAQFLLHHVMSSSTQRNGTPERFEPIGPSFSALSELD